MIKITLGLVALLQVSPSPAVTQQSVKPVLSFPEPGLDDAAAYQGYQTRFYRDTRGNTVQIYLDPTAGRVVHLWADAADESLGFTLRDGEGKVVPLAWGDSAAQVTETGNRRRLQYRLRAGSPSVALGLFLLGSMRVERDFQYSGTHRGPITPPPAAVVEESLLVANLTRLPRAERSRQLSLLGASSLAGLNARLRPTVQVVRAGPMQSLRVSRPSLDGRNHLTLEILIDPRQARLKLDGSTASIESRGTAAVELAIAIETDATALHPLTREQIFNREFLTFLDQARKAGDRRLEREVRSIELLASQEKLMAGLPNFATYFGRDMLMTSLMMQSIWSTEMSEHVIASVLRKLGPAGDVSHEEALGGQAIREAAAEYNEVIPRYLEATESGRQSTADSLGLVARRLLVELQRTRENYHMLDDEFQLPVLAARYLTDSLVPQDRKRAFLLDSRPGEVPRLALLLREFRLVAEETRAYAERPEATNLVGFEQRDPGHWRSSSWRDSDAGYGNGRFAMDINAIWVPEALASMGRILGALPRLGISRAVLDSIAPDSRRSPLAGYLDAPASLDRAIETWRGARQHFLVTIPSRLMSERIDAKLAWLPADERSYWDGVLDRRKETPDSVRFMALALDAEGRPIPIMSTDPATEFFLRDFSEVSRLGSAEALLSELDAFLRPYPIGLLIDGLGPVVSNDTYASEAVWEAFKRDTYHSPRVVWGREVNLLFLGLARQISSAFDQSGKLRDPGLAGYVAELKEALNRTRTAVTASGLEHNELWSYRIEGGRLQPIRYGSGSDVQLWSSTDLAVQFELSRLPSLSPPPP